MLKIIIFALVLAAIALSGVMSVAISVTSTETVPSPLQQVRDGVPTGEVVCSNDRVLMVSQTGMPACVFEESVLELDKRGFEFIGEPFDMFPIKSSNAQHGSSSIGQTSTPPVVSMSVLPSINETAIVEITYTNQIGVNVTDAENFSIRDGYAVGWVVSSGFEMVDSGGVEPWTMYANKDEPPVTAYLEFVPLDVGESKTYRIEVRAANEGASYVAGFGYDFATARTLLYVDDEETLHYQEHLERYPEMHTAPEHKTPAEDAQPWRGWIIESIKAYLASNDSWQDIGSSRLSSKASAFGNLASNDPGQNIGSAIDFIHITDTHQSLVLTDIKQILGDAGYADDEIEAEWSKRAYALMWMNRPGVLIDAGDESAPFYAEYGKTVYMTYIKGGLLRDQLNGQELQAAGSADPSNPDVQGLMDHMNLDLLYSGSQSLVSDLEVSYAVHLKSFEDHMADNTGVKQLCAALDSQTEGSCDYSSIDYTVILEGSISNLATTDSQTELLERGWGLFIIPDEVVIDGVDVNRPIGILESRLPETHELLAGTAADKVLLQPIINVGYVREQSMADWHFHQERSVPGPDPRPNLGYLPFWFDYYWTLGELKSENGGFTMKRYQAYVQLDRPYFLYDIQSCWNGVPVSKCGKAVIPP